MPESNEPAMAWVERVLVVDDDQDIQDICTESLADEGFSAQAASSVPAALEELGRGRYDIVLTDLHMPSLSGIDLLRTLKSACPDVDVIVMTGYATVATAVECLKLGAHDYIAKPFAPGDLVHRVRQLAAKRELASENRLLRGQVADGRGPAGMIGGSRKMRELYRLLARLASRSHPVLIVGESGTGKELAARALHELGGAASQPFVAVDCGALNATLMESELFGHRQGSFTGATQHRSGLLATAGRGSIFLDEIGELPLELQAKLLRALQEHEFRPVGGNQTQRFEARVLAATHRDLQKAVESGSFRADLYYRLNVLAVLLPPLRERKEDIPALVQSVIDSERQAGHCDVSAVSKGALEQLMKYDWPGNVRELRNHVQRALAIGTGPLLAEQDLSPELRGNASATGLPSASAADVLTSLEEIERRAILRTLEVNGGHRLAAARQLGIGKTTMYKKLREYGITT